MSIYHEKASNVLKTWFNKALPWQKDLFIQLWSGVSLEDAFKRSVKVIEQSELSINHNISIKSDFPSGIVFSDSVSTPIYLESISNVQGVGALAPIHPLEFGKGLTIVYGGNGCGKSSYARILKSAENPHNSSGIIGNIFKEEEQPAKATLIFNEDGETHKFDWNKDSDKSSPIQIYDTASAYQFVEKENEVIYEPKVLSIISKLVDIYSKLSEYFQNKKMISESQFIPIPKDSDNIVINKFNNANNLKDFDKLLLEMPFDESLQGELIELEKCLTEENPEKLSRSMSAQKSVIEKHKNLLLSLRATINDDFCDRYLKERKKQIESKLEYDNLLESAKSKSVLEKFGSKSWRDMWSYAEKYANEINVTVKSNPIAVNDRCVLCQQYLDSSAYARINALNDFRTSYVAKELQNAQKNFEESVSTVQNYISKNLNIEAIETELVANSVSDEYKAVILSQYKVIYDRCSWLLSFNDDTKIELPSNIDYDEFNRTFDAILNSLNIRIKTLTDISTNREEKYKRYLLLTSIWWINENKNCKIDVIRYLQIIGKCKTNSLTTLKKDLSDILITETYISRFSEEMKKIDQDSRIKVELVSAGAKKGRTYHQISLKGALGAGKKKKAGEILSEGEFRVVSIAAFLADLSSWEKIMPFIFDDPITSLDHNFEESVANRLVELSTNRQVIVFTHRINFVRILVDCATEYNNKISSDKKEVEIKHIELRSSPLGEPCEPSYTSKPNLSSNFNYILNQDIPQIKKSQEKGDYVYADVRIRGLCTQIRTLVEYGIEHNLLCGIVKRFSMSVSTLMLPYLYALKEDDVKLFDEMMTKYSKYEHSQSNERQIPLPTIEMIEEDVKKMIDWCGDYKKRTEAAKKKKENIAKTLLNSSK